METKKMLTEPFLRAKPVIENIEAHGYKAYFVGGCVRDLLLKREIKDVDIATSALPEEIQAIFDKVIPVGIEHGTVIVRHAHESYEVTTFRLDGIYTDQRHPDQVEFIDQIDEDLRRRDFTMNAIAMDISGNQIDLFGGAADIEAGLIRTVGNGYDRFMEDALRIIRGLRFASQLGFSIEPETLDHMHQVKQQIESLAVERLANEFTKLFAGDYVEKGLNYLETLEIDSYLPVLDMHPNIIKALPKSFKPLQTFAEVIALFHIVEPTISIQTWITAWKCSNQTKQEAVKLVQAFLDYRQNGLNALLVYRLTPAYFTGFLRLLTNLLPESVESLAKLVEIKIEIPIESKSDFALNGHDISALFPDLKKGKWLGILMDQLEIAIVFGKIGNTKSELKDWIKWNPPEVN